MEGKREKIRKRKTPDFFRKIRLDKRIAAVLVFAAAAACILLVFQLYAMRQVSILEYNASAVPEEAVLSGLREGSLDQDEAVWLTRMEEGEAIYRRGRSWFFGDGRTPFAGSAPIYVNDGAYLWVLAEDTELINEDWDWEPGAAGMYIGDGSTFNFDGSSTGDLPVLFLRLSSGVFLNTVSMQVESGAGNVYLPANSYLFLNEEGIRSLIPQSGEKLLYEEIPAAFGTMVTIHGESLTYEQLLRNLGLLQDEIQTELPEISPKTDEPVQEEVLPEEEGQEAERDSQDKADREKDVKEPDEEEKENDSADGNSGGHTQTTAGETEGLAQGTGGQTQGAQAGGSSGSTGSSGSGSSSGEGSESGSSDGSSGSDDGNNAENDEEKEDGGEAGDDAGKGEAGGEGQTPGGSSGSGTPDAGNPGQGGEGTEGGNASEQPGESGDDPSVNTPGDDVSDNPEDSTGEGESGEGGAGSLPPGDINPDGGANPAVWQKPQPSIVYGDDDISIYSWEAELRVVDTYGCFDRVVLMFSWDLDHPNDTPDENTPVQLRRTLQELGDFSVDNLPPDEKIYVQAFLYYYDENGDKIQEEDPFQAFVIKTDEFGKITPVSLKFSDAIKDSSDGFYYENRIGLYDMILSGTNSNSLDKIFRGELQVYRKGDQDPLYSFSLTSGVLNKFKESKGVDYQSLMSQYSLPANTEYRYRLEFFDRYNNSFNEAGKVYWGEQQIQNPDYYIRADGYEEDGVLYEPKTSEPWRDSYVQAGAESGYWGYTHTSKTVPSVKMETTAEKDPFVTLSQMEVTMEVEDIHEALSVLQAEKAGCLGDPPQSGGREYQVYFALYESSTGYDIGKEVYFTRSEDSAGRPVLSIGENTPNGYVRYDKNTEGAEPYSYVRDGSLPDGIGENTYLFSGLTAGETYMVRVFATYDLNDNHPELTREAEIGTMRFSATPMSSYGRIFYNISGSHIHTEQPQGGNSYDHTRYESSTAQEITVKINSQQTKERLVSDFFHKLDFTLSYRTGTKETLASFSFLRDQGMNKEIQVAESQLSDTGWYTYELKAQEDYTCEVTGGNLTPAQLPTVSLDIPVRDLFTPTTPGSGGAESYYTVNLWEAFCGVKSDDGTFAPVMPQMRFRFDEDSLQSYTAYTFLSASTASQGGREHVVTAASSTYRQCSFTTLKDMPYVTMEDMLQVGRYLYLVGLDFHDLDQSIQNGAVTVTNTDVSQRRDTVQSITLDYEASAGGYIAKIDISALREGREYELKICADDIRREGRAGGSYRYQNEVLYTLSYVAGEGVSGSIRLNSLYYPLEQLSQGTDQHVLSEYSKYEVGNFEYGYPSIVGGEITYQSQGTYWQTATPIAVNPGEIYYLNRLAASANCHLVYLDSSQKPVGTVHTMPAKGGYIKIPDGAYYMQFSMCSTMTDDNGRTVYSSTQAQALKIYDAADAPLTRLEFVTEPEKTDGRYTAAKGDLLAVVNSEWYSGARPEITFTEYDGNGKQLGTSSKTAYYPGRSYEVKDSAAASVAVTLNGNLTGADGSAVSLDVRRIDQENTEAFSKMLFDNLVTNYTASVSDRTGSLYLKAGEADNIHINVWKTNNSTGERVQVEDECYSGRITNYVPSADTAGQYSNGTYVNNRSFASDAGYTYEIQLSITWQGQEFILDTQEIDATGNIYTISTGKQMLKTITWPTGSFLVLDDLEVDENTRAMVNQTFYGNLNGQGHSLTMDLNSYLYSQMGGTGVIENMELILTMESNKADGTPGSRKYRTALIEDNYGTLRNIVFRFSLGNGNYSHYTSAGLCLFNFGTIENFAIYYSDSSTNTMGSNIGAACYYNKGTIRNGFVYSPSILRVSTGVYGGTTDVGLSNAGGLAGYNAAGGLIENVYALFNAGMGVEQNSNAKSSSTSLSGTGLLVGGNAGMIRNSFTSGEMYYQEWQENVAGEKVRVSTAVSAYRNWPGTQNQGKNYEENCYYISNTPYLKNDSYTQHAVMDAVLESTAFYNGSINKGGAFLVESQLEQGYYPIVDMPECMDGVQTSISFSSSGVGAYPTYLTSALANKNLYLAGGTGDASYRQGDVLSAEEYQALAAAYPDAGWDTYLAGQEDGTYLVQQQFALMQITFGNNGGYEIADLDIQGLTAQVLDADLEKISVLTVLLTPGTWQNTQAVSYGSSFRFLSFSYGRAGMSRTSYMEDRYVNVKFYYPLSMESWAGAPVNAEQSINYQLTEDIIFRELAEEDRPAALSKFRNANITGEFDGQGYALDYEGTDPGNYVFYSVQDGGTMNSLYVENLTLKRDSSSGYLGLIRTASSNARLEDIHMRNVALEDAYTYAGSLAAYTSDVSIANCTVAGVSVTSYQTATNLYVGGLIGCSASGTGINIQNCFVTGLDMKITQGSSVLGVGGMIGFMYKGSESDQPTLKACYVEGDIRTSFSNCGGIAGRCNGAVTDCWSAVNIYGSNRMGAAIGFALTTNMYNFNFHSNLVMSGELYSSTGEIESRVVGGWELAETRVPQSYAYSGQLLNSAPSTDPMDADALSDAADMREYYFWTDVAGLGEAWNLYGTGTIEGVRDAYVYPTLYYTDGETPLPDQEAVYYELEKPIFALKEADAELISKDNLGEYKLAVTLQFGIEQGSVDDMAAYFKEQILPYVEAEGLKLLGESPKITTDESDTDADVILRQSTMETVRDGEAVTVNCIEAVYQKVEAMNRWDSYRISYEPAGMGKTTQKLEFDEYLYWWLQDAAQWEELLVDGAYGGTFENVKIVNDLNFTAGSIRPGSSLKLNRLEGDTEEAWSEEDYVLRSRTWADRSEFKTISGFTASTAGDPWISEVSGRLGEIQFSDISILGAAAQSNFGLVGTLTGDAEHVDFKKISIRAGSGTGTYNYLGCIGYASGDISDCRLYGVQIAGMPSTYYYSYVGGLAGYAARMENVYAWGDADNAYSVTMGDTLVLSRDYFGGIAGYIGSFGSRLYGEDMTVMGRRNTGGLAGYIYKGLSEVFLRTDEPEYQAMGMTVDGQSAVGGIFGYAANNISNARVIGAKVTSRGDAAGGIAGYSWIILKYSEAYDVQVTAAGQNAGGVSGHAYQAPQYCRAADVSVQAASCAGGIVGSSYGALTGCSVTSSDENSPSTITSTVDYAGGIVGRMFQQTEGNATSSLQYNAVSRTTITAEKMAGGVAGSMYCAEVSYNETDDSTKVQVRQYYGGGIAGELQGCHTTYNISGAQVTDGNAVGGVAGLVVGYGRSTTNGGRVPFNVSLMYGNVAANAEIKGNSNVGGLIGLFIPGDKVIDPSSGKDISDDVGWTQYMANTNFYGNTIAPQSLKSANTTVNALISWYANYDDNSSYSSKAVSRYDCVLDTLVADQTSLKIPDNTPGTGPRESGLTSVNSGTLKTADFYTRTLANGGMGFNAAYVDTSGTDAGYYPYVMNNGFRLGNSSSRSIIVPYQTEAVDIYNQTWERSGNTAKSKAFDGDGIPIAASSTNALALFDLNAAQNIAYASGINTLNLDFTHIDSTMIGFKVLDAYGRTLVPDTTLESAAGTGKVCTIDYDYQTDIVVVLYSADYMEQKTYPYLAKQLRNSVMAWGDDYYYLSSDGVYKGTGDGETELVEAGDFVHLFGGQALTKDGQAVDLQ